MAELKKLEVERENLKASLRDNEERFKSLQAEHSQQIDLRENKLKELVATAYLSLPEDRQAALQYYLDRDKSRIDILTTLRAAQIEIARLRASEQAVTIPAPEGRVCLVFTDVQDSTSLWDANPDVMGAALDVHNSLMRTFITRYRGYEVKTEGDAFMIAFSDPIDALQWCLDIQVSLTLCDWPPELLENPSACVERDEVSQRVLYAGLRVRIGAHVGNPLCTKDPNTGRMDYFGPDVNRAARVSGAAHGGQVVVSKDIFDLVQDDLEGRLDNPIVTDLGSHKMKGLRVETELIQLVPQHLAGRKFAPVKTVTTSLLQMEKVHASKDPLASMGFDQAPPMGRCAIVITNIMGGQKFWEEKPSDMAVAFETHGHVLRDNTRKFKGYVVKSEGDKHLIAFSDVAKAVSFALAVQEELVTCNWPSALEDFPTAARAHNDAGDLLFAGLRVAIGINYGEPICRPNPSTKRMDYTGIVVNTTARVVGAATGGQIIITDRVDEELKKEQGWQAVAVDCETQDLGTHAFHGIKQPARLIQVLPRSLLGREFPPPKTLSTAAALKSKETDEGTDPLRDASKAPVSDVTFVVSKVENLDHLWEVLPSETRVALDLYIELIRTGLRQFSGYEVDSTNGRFVCAFHNAIDASSFSLYVQRKLLDIKWPYGLRESAVTGDEFDAAGNILNAGLRVAMGIHTEDPIASIDETSGTMMYHGHAVPTLNAIGEAAHGGQILMDKASYSAVVTNQEELGSPQMRLLGQHQLPGVSQPEVLTEMLPRDLAGRVFPEPHTLTVAEQARRSFLQEAQVAATAALAQQQKNEKVAPWGDIFVVMVDVGDAEKLWLGDPSGMLQASRVFVAMIRDHIRRYGGFEITNHELMFVVAFQKASKAFNFALDVHTNLLRATWPQTLLAIPEATQVYDGDGEVVLNGLRARISINYGKPTRSLDPATKRDTFIGSVIDNCGRVLHAARPGQTILERSARIHVTNTLRKELVEDVEVKSMGEHLLTGLPAPLQLFLFSSVSLLGRPFQPLETATNQLAGLRKKSEALKKRLKEIELEEKMARKSENLSVIAAVQARASIIKEQLADLESTSENIKDVTIRAEASDDRNLQALVTKQHDLLSIVYPNASKAGDEDGLGDIEDLAQLAGDLTVLNQIKLLRNEALMFEQNLSHSCSTDKDREDMLIKALRVLFRRLGILYNMCPVLEKGVEKVSDQVDFLQNILPKAGRHGRGRPTVGQGRGGTGPNLEELDASEIDTFRRHIESMFGAQGPESGSKKDGSKSRKNRLRSAPGHRAGYESFMAAQSMMSLVEQASSAVQYKFPKGKKLQSRPNSSNRYQSVRAPMIPGSAVIDLAAVSREASRNRFDDDSDGSDDVHLANSRHTGSNTSQDSRNPRRRASAGRSRASRRRRRSADKRRKEPPIENPVAPQLGFRPPRRMDSDSSLASDASELSNLSVHSGTGQTAGHIINLAERGKKPPKSNTKTKRRPRSSVQKRSSSQVTRSPSEVLRPVREMESTSAQLELAASESKPKAKFRLGAGVQIGGTFKSPPTARNGEADGDGASQRGKAGQAARSQNEQDLLESPANLGLLRIPEGEEEDAVSEHSSTGARSPAMPTPAMDALTESAPMMSKDHAAGISLVRSSKSAENLVPEGDDTETDGENPPNTLVVSGSSAKASAGTNFDQESVVAEEFDISDSEVSGDDASADSLRNYRPKSGGKRAGPPPSQPRPTRVRKTQSTGSHGVVDHSLVDPEADPDSDKSLMESSAALIDTVRRVLSRASMHSSADEDNPGDWPPLNSSSHDSEGEDDNVWFTKGVRIDNVDLGPLFHRAFEIRKFRIGYLFERLKILHELKYIQREADRVFDGISYSSKINRQRKAYIAYRERVLVRRLQDVMVTIESIHDESYDLRKSTMMALNLLLPQFGEPSQERLLQEHYERKREQQEHERARAAALNAQTRGSVANLQRTSGAGFKITKLKGPSRSGSETHLGDSLHLPSRHTSMSMSQLYEHSATPGSLSHAGHASVQPRRRQRYLSGDVSDFDDDDRGSETSRASRRSGIYVHNRNKSSMKSLVHRGRQDSDMESSGHHDSRENVYPSPISTFAGGHARQPRTSDTRDDGPAALSIGKSLGRSRKLQDSKYVPQSAPIPRRGIEASAVPPEAPRFTKGLSPSTPRNAPPGNPSPRRAQVEQHTRLLSIQELQEMRNPKSPRVNNLKVRRGLSMAHPLNQKEVQHETGTESPRNMLGAPISGKAPMVQRDYAPSNFR
eukprot:TRINITY_DN1094_c0_g2_i1.p1 TRINITY_DN1094_c0_g2~~TRINITY_DN1094_c0_g2_i1.p1  ORF type:complete len:2257 (+),score=384.66 TRINITY_DN1094_c0_g2_i1:614-7384(+)